MTGKREIGRQSKSLNRSLDPEFLALKTASPLTDKEANQEEEEGDRASCEWASEVLKAVVRLSFPASTAFFTFDMKHKRRRAGILFERFVSGSTNQRFSY